MESNCFFYVKFFYTKNENGWNNKGVGLANLQRYEEAIACYDKAREIHPNYVDGCRNKGLALESLKKYEEAIA
ncbi:MAG: tetratricopeptide repeat protein [Nitrosopumilales archaeon]|nr:tetratricopeptide repeat protein [Nitrosopumilales archaeon]